MSRHVHHGTFGSDRFGVLAERFARAFGTPQFIVGQTIGDRQSALMDEIALALRAPRGAPSAS